MQQFFFLQTIKCVTVYSRALLHTEGCLYPHLEAYRSNFYMRMYIYFIKGTDGTLNWLLIVRYRRQMKGLHMILYDEVKMFLVKYLRNYMDIMLWLT